jgi:hypothetical protein
MPLFFRFVFSSLDDFGFSYHRNRFYPEFPHHHRPADNFQNHIGCSHSDSGTLLLCLLQRILSPGFLKSSFHLFKILPHKKMHGIKTD